MTKDDFIKDLAEHLTFRQVLWYDIRAKVLVRLEVLWLKITGRW